MAAANSADRSDSFAFVRVTPKTHKVKILRWMSLPELISENAQDLSRDADKRYWPVA